MRLHQAGGALGHQRLELDAVDDVERIDDVALGLGHLLAFGVAHQAVDVDLAERHLAHELQADMIMRATQKKMMSKPVTSTLVG